MLKKQTIVEANTRISSFIKKTPLITSGSMNEISGANLFFKCENFQKTGAFKMRGASNAVLSLSLLEKEKGVCTHSSGNFAQALAYAAKRAATKAFIVMPHTAPEVKKEAVRGYGGRIIFCEPTLEAREEGTRQVMAREGATFIHPYNNYEVIAGHGSIVIEMLETAERKYGRGFIFDCLVAPVGGGGLASGVALTSHFLSPRTRIFGAEPEAASDAALSLKTGIIQPSLNPKTIADGLLTSLGDKTFPILKRYLEEIITVSEKEIVASLKLLWERMKIVAEPSSAVALAAVLKGKEKFKGKNVGIVISGGNVDFPPGIFNVG